MIGYGAISFPFRYFEIGDKIYDENYKVTRKDYSNKEYFDKRNSYYELQKNPKFKNFNFKLEDVLNGDVKKKGMNTIKDLKDAKISALNYAKSKK